MMLTMLKSKIHKASITQCRLHYEGSITIDEDLMEQANMLPHEQVDVLNVNNGERFTTYTLAGKRNSGIIAVNGAAARLAQEGDSIIIIAYSRMEEAEAKKHTPTILLMNPDNTIKFDDTILKEVTQ